MEMNWDYIAGFFDGEGSLSTMNFTRRNTLAASIVTISQSGEEGRIVLGSIRDFMWDQNVKSYVHSCQRPAGRRMMWNLKISARPSVSIFLDKMLSRTSVKHLIVQDTLRFIKAFPSVQDANRRRDRGKYGSANLDPDVLRRERESGMKYIAIARKHRVDYYTIKKYLDPEYRRKYDDYRKRWRERQIVNSEERRQVVA